MSKPKPKRNKAYKPRPMAIPMMRESRNDLALTLRMSIEALITAPSLETLNEASMRLATMGWLLGDQDCMEEIKHAILDVFDRYQRVGRVGVNAAEAEVLRRTAGEIDAAIPYLSLTEYLQAEIKTRAWLENSREAA